MVYFNGKVVSINLIWVFFMPFLYKGFFTQRERVKLLSRPKKCYFHSPLYGFWLTMISQIKSIWLTNILRCTKRAYRKPRISQWRLLQMSVIQILFVYRVTRRANKDIFFVFSWNKNTVTQLILWILNSRKRLLQRKKNILKSQKKKRRKWKQVNLN